MATQTATAAAEMVSSITANGYPFVATDDVGAPQWPSAKREISDELLPRYVFSLNGARHFMPPRASDRMATIFGDSESKTAAVLASMRPVFEDYSVEHCAVDGDRRPDPATTPTTNASVIVICGSSSSYTKALAKAAVEKHPLAAVVAVAAYSEWNDLMDVGVDLFAGVGDDAEIAIAMRQARRLAAWKNRAHVMEHAYQRMFNMAEHNAVALGYCMSPNGEPADPRQFLPKYAYVNRSWERLFRETYASVFDHSVAEYGHFILHERNKQEMLGEMMQEVLNNDRSVKRLWYKTGGPVDERAYFPGTSSIYNAYGADHELLSSCFSTHDNTDLQHALDQCEALNARLKVNNDELVRVMRIKDEFLQNTTHELRTPLNGIIGLSEMLADMFPSDVKAIQLAQSDADRVARTVRMVAQSGRRLSNIVNAILLLTKLRSGETRMEFSECNALDLVQRAVSHAHGEASRRGVKIQLDADDDAKAAVVSWDVKHVREQMLAPLLSNAVKFARSRVNVRISCAANDNNGEKRLDVRVADDGTEGIERAHWRKVFKPFRQVDASATRKTEGIGLGLTLARCVAERHGGSVAVESSAPGVGTTMHVSLPVKAQPSDGKPLLSTGNSSGNISVSSDRTSSSSKKSSSSSSAIDKVSDALAVMRGDSNAHRATEPEEGAVSSATAVAAADDDSTDASLLDADPTKHITVLTVDDDPTNQQVLAMALARHADKYTVVSAMSGPEAMKSIADARGDIDVMLLDEMMPEMTGTEVCRKLRSANKRKPIIIMLSAKDDSATVCRSFDAGVDDYVTKPFNADVLLARMRSLLQRRQYEEQRVQRMCDAAAKRSASQQQLAIAPTGTPESTPTAGMSAAAAASNISQYGPDGAAFEIAELRARVAMLDSELVRANKATKQLSVTQASNRQLSVDYMTKVTDYEQCVAKMIRLREEANAEKQSLTAQLARVTEELERARTTAAAATTAGTPPPSSSSSSDTIGARRYEIRKSSHIHSPLERSGSDSNSSNNSVTSVELANRVKPILSNSSNIATALRLAPVSPPWRTIRQLLVDTDMDKLYVDAYDAAMRAHDVGVQELAMCTAQDLRMMGVTRVGHILRILRTVRPFAM